MAKEARYMQVATTEDIKAEVSEMAQAERRSLAEQGGVIFEIGLQEYRRREQLRHAALNGGTQIDADALRDPALLERIR